MSILTEGENSFFITTSAILINDEKDIASNWASSHIYTNEALKWVIGKYVEADQANSNGQMWALEDLRMKFPTINHGPMNIDHHQDEIVGTWVASELLYPTEEQSNAAFNPYVEVLGAFWKAYFPDTLKDVESAFNSGALAISMECQSESVTCSGTEAACGETFPYSGPFGNYCEHIKERASYRQLNNPHFLGGALILPPNKPGWKSAHVTEVSDLTTNEDADQLMEKVAEQHPEASEQDWQAIMEAIVYRATLDKFTKVS